MILLKSLKITIIDYCLNILFNKVLLNLNSIPPSILTEGDRFSKIHDTEIGCTFLDCEICYVSSGYVEFFYRSYFFNSSNIKSHETLHTHLSTNNYLIFTK